MRARSDRRSFPLSADMLWTGIGVSVIVVIVVTAAMLTKYSGRADELGTVSDRWIAQHRVDSP